MSVFLTSDGVSNRGRVVAFEPAGDSEGATFDLEDWSGFLVERSIMVGVSIAGGTLHQYDHMLAPRIYLNVFGDQMGMCSLSGLAFAGTCTDKGTTNGNAHGISRVIEYYNRNRLSVRADPIKITINPFLVLEGYLEKIRCGVLDVSNKIYQFNLMFGLIPQES